MIKLGITLFGLLIILSGCANQVTNKFESEKKLLTLEWSITLNSIFNLDHYSYLIILSRRPNDTPSIVLPEKVSSIQSREYLPFPGSTYDDEHPMMQSKINLSIDNDDGINSFYSSYFKTWTDVLIIHKNTSGTPEVSLVNANTTSPDFFPSTATRQSHSNSFPSPSFDATYALNSPSQTLVFSCDLQELYPSQEGTIYASIISIDISQNTISPTYFKSGELVDFLTTTPEIVIPIDSNVDVDATDENDSGNTAIPSSADIISWRVRIF